jgi:hypothetical protein
MEGRVIDGVSCSLKSKTMNHFLHFVVGMMLDEITLSGVVEETGLSSFAQAEEGLVAKLLKTG